jgi:hypothetical protein
MVWGTSMRGPEVVRSAGSLGEMRLDCLQGRTSMGDWIGKEIY